MGLIEQVRKAGVIGAGGGGFPTYAKLDCQAEYILLNGAECEPLLRVDQQLLAIHPDEIIRGLQAAAQVVNAKKAILGVKEKHHEVIKILRERIQAICPDSGVSVGCLPDIYPAGDEMVLVYELTGRIVPEGGIPKSVGCVVVNAETCLNIYRAVNGQSVTDKYLTLAGDIPERKTVCVPVGTPVRDVLRMSGLSDLTGYRVIIGGPMMGSLLDDLNGYVTKKDKGFIILREDHPLIHRKMITVQQAKKINRSACEQCRMCTDLCPRFLIGHNMQPHKMMRALSYAPDNPEVQTNAALCSQCNLCEYFSCPANLHPRMTNMIFKENLAQAGLRYQPMTDKYQARDIRPYRMVPSKRLIAHLALKEFDRPAPWREEVPALAYVRIATKQNAGVAASAVVFPGDHVEKGQVIADVPDDTLGVPIHASITGVVSECRKEYIEIKAVNKL